MASASAIIPVGYKQTEVGVIPDDWESKSVEDVSIEMVQGVNTAIDIPEYVESGVPMLKANNVIDGNIILDECDFVSQRTYCGYSERFKIKQFDFLFSNIGARLGTGSLFNFNVDATYAWNVMRIRPRKEYVLPFYLSHVINSNIFYQQIQANLSGSGMGFVPKKVLKDLQIPVPPKQEQSRIEEILTDSDSQIQALENLIVKKRDVKQGTMQELLTGKTRLPGFSRPWQSFSLQQLAIINKGTQLNRSEIAENGLHPHLNGGINPSNYTNKWNVDENTIAISEGGNSCGYVQFVTVPYWCGGHCYSVISKGINNNFLYHALKFKEALIMRLRVGSGLPNVQKSALLEFKIRFPINSGEQKAIAEILSDMDSEIAVLEQRLEKTKAIKQGMMQQLLTGRIRLMDPSTPVEASA